MNSLGSKSSSIAWADSNVGHSIDYFRSGNVTVDRNTVDHKYDKTELIRGKMDFIRHKLDDDVTHVKQSAKTLSNWKYYVKKYPWVCLGAAAAVGYLVVPRKLQIQTPDAKTLEKLARKNRLVVENKPKAQAQSGAIGAAFTFLSGLALRTAAAHVGSHLASVVNQKQNSDSRAQETADSANHSVVETSDVLRSRPTYPK